MNTEVHDWRYSHSCAALTGFQRQLERFVMTNIEQQPQGTLTLQTLSMPADTNPLGDIFGGWLLSQMDIAGAILAIEIAHGRVTTVAVSSMKFLHPVPVGSLVSCYSVLRAIGNTSIRVGIEVWIKDFKTHKRLKVTEGEFVYVAIDERGTKRPVNS